MNAARKASFWIDLIFIDSLHDNFVILRMGFNEIYQHHPGSILHFHDQVAFVPSNIKYHAVVALDKTIGIAHYAVLCFWLRDGTLYPKRTREGVEIYTLGSPSIQNST